MNEDVLEVLGPLLEKNTVEYFDTAEGFEHDGELAGFEHLFVVDDVDTILAVRPSELQYRLSLEWDQWTFEFEDESEFIGELTQVVNLLTSRFLHHPDQTISGLLVSYDLDQGVLYRLGMQGEVDELDPQEESPTVMQSYTVTSSDNISFGPLKAVVEMALIDRWLAIAFVFEEAVMLLLDLRDTNRSEEKEPDMTFYSNSDVGEGIEGDITPLLYDSAYVDYLISQSARGDDDVSFLYVAEDVPAEIVGKSI